MRVTLLASGEFACPTLDALLASGHEVSLGTQPARPAGRGRKARATPLACHAAGIGLEAHELPDVNAPEALRWLASTQPDLLLVVAFGQKLGAAVRATAPWGCLNIHPSLLPRWRGAAPVPATILAGDEIAGVCVTEVVERMDAGPLLAAASTSVSGKTAGQLLEELAALGAKMLLRAMDALARGDAERRPQDEAKVTRAPKLCADDGRLRWEHDAVDVDRRVRAVTPRPGAFSLLPDGKRLRILAGEPLDWPRGKLPGEVCDAPGLVVACGRGAYRLLRVQRQGGRPQATETFLRGHALEAATRLGP